MSLSSAFHLLQLQSKKYEKCYYQFKEDDDLLLRYQNANFLRDYLNTGKRRFLRVFAIFNLVTGKGAVKNALLEGFLH